YLHNLTKADGLALFWIPYYGAPGIAEWTQLGFDGAILQPNYYELNKPTPDRIQAAVTDAHRYGLGLEMEVDGNALASTSAAQKYLTELQLADADLNSALTAHPGPNPVVAFYAGSKVLVNAYRSTDQQVRAMYDATGRWVQQH
ncbi:MAG: DUF4855 domain-containing protein, partial [Alicyclobacillus sp.]|nr:DUF4855 domain-containing protein [Alicyclobacillus sp.]